MSCSHGDGLDGFNYFYLVKSRRKKIQYILVTGVNRIMLTRDNYLTLESKSGRTRLKLKKTKRKFLPFGMEEKLPCLGGFNVRLRAVAGATICHR